VHWGKEIKAKAKTQTLIATGQGHKVAAQAKTQREKEVAADRRREEERKAVNALYRRVYPALAEAVLAATPKADAPAAVTFLWAEIVQNGKRQPKEVVTVDDLVRYWARELVEREEPNKSESTWTNHRHELDVMVGLATMFGVDHAAIVAEAKKAIAAEAPAPTKTAAAAKASTRTTAGKRR